MRMSELKEKWEFTGLDVEEQITKIYDLLTYYDHSVSKYGIACALDEFIDNNKDNILTIMKSPYYNGNLQIVKEIDMERVVDPNLINRFFNNFKYAVSLLSKTDENGNTVESIIQEAVKNMPTTVSLTNLPTCNDLSDSLSKFDLYGYTNESVLKNKKYIKLMNKIRYVYDSTFNSELSEEFNDIDADLKLNTGMKTSRVFNRIITKYGVDKKINNYNKALADYGDLINTSIIKRLYVISYNPYDYLTSSFGNSWASCHTIDHHNKRRCENSYHGMYRGGTLSYMLDKVTAVTYIVTNAEENKAHPELADKIYRNMMHYSNGWLVQGRVYPQSNDGALNLYKLLRNLFQEEICNCIGVQNTWVKKGDSYASRHNGIFESDGVHYRDYEQAASNYRNCNVTYIKNYDLGGEFTIGHEGICLYSGYEYSSAGNLVSDEEMPDDAEELMNS